MTNPQSGNAPREWWIHNTDTLGDLTIEGGGRLATDKKPIWSPRHEVVHVIERSYATELEEKLALAEKERDELRKSYDIRARMYLAEKVRADGAEFNLRRLAPMDYGHALNTLASERIDLEKENAELKRQLEAIAKADAGSIEERRNIQALEAELKSAKAEIERQKLRADTYLKECGNGAGEDNRLLLQHLLLSQWKRREDALAEIKKHRDQK